MEKSDIMSEKIQIVEVKTRKQQKLFVDFPTKLYKDNEYYVHPFRSDELNLFNKKKNASYEDCDTAYFLAYKDNKVVGRIAGIVQRLHNAKTGEKRARFTRFDAINDNEVSQALFNAVENWAKNQGMNKVHGPLGFNDLDREGLLIEGFDQLSTFEEQYNYEYYPSLIENAGYKKEVDWLEYRLFPPKETDPRIARLSEVVMKRYKLHYAEEKSKKKFIQKYKKQIFEMIDEAYASLYGTVPFNDKMRDQIISQFYLVIKLDYVVALLNEKEELVAFGFAIPSISESVRKSKGRLTPLGIIRILHEVKHTKRVDLGLIGVRPDYLGKGLPAVCLQRIVDRMSAENLEYFETNLNLEDNLSIQQTWKNFEHIQHKRRRCYLKELETNKVEEKTQIEEQKQEK